MQRSAKHAVDATMRGRLERIVRGHSLVNFSDIRTWNCRTFVKATTIEPIFGYDLFAGEFIVMVFSEYAFVHVNVFQLFLALILKSWRFFLFLGWSELIKFIEARTSLVICAQVNY